LIAFADNISLSIETARLYKQSLEKERYERELLLAQDIQRKLLPAEVPKVTSFDLAAYSSPAYEVGGDYYDFVELKNGMPCIVIGDVSGKGVSAAFYMAELKGTVLASAHQSCSPKTLLERVNKALHGSLDKKTYVTMIAVALDTENCCFHVARAGHTPLLIRNGEGVHSHTPKGFGIGLVNSSMFDRTLEQITIPATEGDVCLLFTDGISEAQNSANEEIGLQPIEDILRKEYESASLISGALLRAVAEYSEGTPQHDDITFVVARCV
jgi:serine phosphatase RsbU (regulator of sigma subunit)